MISNYKIISKIFLSFILRSLRIRLYRSLHVTVAQSKNCPFGVGTAIKLGQAVAQFVEVLRYKLEGRGFDSRWCHGNFSLTQSFQPHYATGVDSTSNRNEYQ